MWAITKAQAIFFFIVKRNIITALCPYKEIFQSPSSHIVVNEMSVLYKHSGKTLHKNTAYLFFFSFFWSFPTRTCLQKCSWAPRFCLRFPLTHCTCSAFSVSSHRCPESPARASDDLNSNPTSQVSLWPIRLAQKKRVSKVSRWAQRPQCDYWLKSLSISLYKAGLCLTWKPMASDGVLLAWANQLWREWMEPRQGKRAVGPEKPNTTCVIQTVIQCV